MSMMLEIVEHRIYAKLLNMYGYNFMNFFFIVFLFFLFFVQFSNQTEDQDIQLLNDKQVVSKFSKASSSKPVNQGKR